MESMINPHMTISKTEVYDVNECKRIESLDIDNEDKKKLKKMIKGRIEGNKLVIHYQLGKNAKRAPYAKGYMGRVFPDGNYGLQTLSKDIRGALGKDYYWDLDIVNCQAEILNQMAGKNGWANTMLTKYCSDRKAIFESLMGDSKMTRNDCKVLFLRLFFGGEPRPGDPEWIVKEFYPEVNSIMENLCAKYPDPFEVAKKTKPANPMGSCCANVLQTEELKCLLHLDAFLTKKDRSMDTLIHDGGLVRKLDGETEFPEKLMREAEAHMLDKTGYDLKLSIKEMTTTFKRPGADSIPDADTYQGVKKEFEKNKFKCVSDACFYDTENQIQTYTKTQIMTAYENMKYTEMTDIGKQNRNPFMKKWLLDEHMRTYQRVDTIIPPLECPDDTYNLWKGLRAENLPRVSKKNVEEYNRVVDDTQFVNDHIKMLCDNDTNCFEYVIKCIAFKLQNPGRKNGIALGFRSSQEGMGKSLVQKFMENIIGPTYCGKIDKPERDLFGTFNGILNNKIWVCIEEMSSRVGFKYSDELKELITGDKFDVSMKGKEASTKNNYLTFMFNTNNDFPVKISENDRRFCFMDCSNQPVPSKAYFDRLVGAINDDLVCRLFYKKMLKVDCSKIDWIRDKPATEMYTDMQQVSRDSELTFLISLYEEELACCGRKSVEISAKDLFCKFMNSIESSNYSTTNVRFGIKIKKYNINGLEKKLSKNGMVYVFNVAEVKKYMITKGYIEEFHSLMREE